jgi:hypothetical protein
MSGSDMSLMMTAGSESKFMPCKGAYLAGLRGTPDGCEFTVAWVVVQLCLKQGIFQLLGQ